jgi:hypothetical protein
MEWEKLRTFAVTILAMHKRATAINICEVSGKQQHFSLVLKRKTLEPLHCKMD